MKLSIYTICKNEVHHVDRFMSTLGEADSIHVLDTGSTDGTVEKLRSYGVDVQVGVFKPWRFDTPRQASMAMVPRDTDICLSIDLDEVLTPGWAAAIKGAWTPETTRLRYKYAWSHLPDGSPGTTFWYDKCHARDGYRWVKPVHEVLVYNGHEVQTYCDGFMLHHWPDQTKSRGSYLHLLELAVKEEPHDDRSCHYLGREYMFYHKYEEAIKELKRHLELPTATWDAERAASMRYIARCYHAQGKYDEASKWAQQAILTAPGEREPYMSMCQVAYAKRDWVTLHWASSKALEITQRPLSYICEPDSWGYMPHDYQALAMWNLGYKEQAIEAAKKAVELEPGDIRLQQNLKLMGGG